MSPERQEFVQANAVALVEERDAKVIVLRKELARLNKRVRAYKREIVRLEKYLASKDEHIKHLELMCEIEKMRKGEPVRNI